MPNYYLHTEPDKKGNYCLHIEDCKCLQHPNNFTKVGNFKRLVDVVTVIKASDYSVSLCKECIDTNYSKSLIKNNDSLFIRLQNSIRKNCIAVLAKKLKRKV